MNKHENLLKLITDMKKYMEGHSERLSKDIENNKESVEQKNFFEGSKQSTDFFVHLINDVITKDKEN